jgi:hypothetical protein
MKPKLRTIRTTRRPTSVPRKAMLAAAKAVTAARDPETDLIVRGLASYKFDNLTVDSKAEFTNVKRPKKVHGMSRK